ncbi:Butirosin biosynthesis protein H, N-terminal [Marinobacter persicus]|uniref:Butirosin biosynthesis protein H, N-terminal n=1 Tax=Marinobacter persicus TaxID=930118 RepID=A0A1I3WR54_9GAMM|nr:BtrH N-terminal domain-containing protein [Marinobacter persicus]GHD48028.1 peptidase [Marinobacter persicus]SFK09327.1 Butirosin biosynthesis protein H, N-terminal [Marinobacter persicus]
MTDFDHQQTAHCESGAVAALLRHNGLDLSEPMVFGLSSALTYAYIPLVKMGGMPLLAYRMPPGRIIRGLSKRLGIRFHFERFRKPADGTAALDRYLEQGYPVGLQASVYWLPYFPENMRFHFNAHNLVAYGKEGDDYLISDPTFEQPVRAESVALQRARFVKGMLAPKGLIYYPESTDIPTDLHQAIPKAINSTARMMLRTPLPFIGVRGIRHVARHMEKLSPANEHHNKLLIGHMVRMQEEIGTGGAGFRFLFASFLQESAGILNNDGLAKAADQFTDAGDEWRRFALYAAKMLKGRSTLDYRKLADQLRTVADMEQEGYRTLLALDLR